MKLNTIGTGGYLTAGLAVLSILVSDVAALPKTPWAQQRAKGQGRKVLSAALDKRVVNQTDTKCTATSALAIQAPKANVWGSLTGPEAAGVVQWLFAQPELNLTVTEDAGNWDNSVYVKLPGSRYC